MAAVDHAVVVGVTSYPGLGDLQGTDNDADVFAEWLLDPALGGVPRDQMHLIQSRRYGGATGIDRPTTADIDHEFQQIIRAKREDYSSGWVPSGRLYIFMAGHGLAPGIEDSGLLAANVYDDFVGHHIPGRLYANWFRAGAYFSEVLLFMDCCRDEYPNTPWRLPPWPQEKRQEGRHTRYLFAFATKWSRKARTRPAVDPDGKTHGYFTYALIEGLKGAPGAVRNGRVTAQSLKDYVYNRMSELVPADVSQEPEFYGPEQDFDILQVGNGAGPAASTALVRIRGSVESGLTLIDGGNRAVPLPSPVDGVIEVALEGGLYLLRSPHGEEYFQVTGGGVLDVSI